MRCFSSPSSTTHDLLPPHYLSPSSTIHYLSPPTSSLHFALRSDRPFSPADASTASWELLRSELPILSFIPPELQVSLSALYHLRPLPDVPSSPPRSSDSPTTPPEPPYPPDLPDSRYSPPSLSSPCAVGSHRPASSLHRFSHQQEPSSHSPPPLLSQARFRRRCASFPLEPLAIAHGVLAGFVLISVKDIVNLQQPYPPSSTLLSNHITESEVAFFCSSNSHVSGDNPPPTRPVSHICSHLYPAESPSVKDILTTLGTELEVAAYGGHNPPPTAQRNSTGFVFNLQTFQAPESPWINDLLSTIGTELEVAVYGDNPPPTARRFVFNFQISQTAESLWVNDLLSTHGTELEVAAYGDNPPPTAQRNSTGFVFNFQTSQAAESPNSPLSSTRNVFKRSALTRAISVVHLLSIAKELQIAFKTIISEALLKKLPVFVFDSNCLTYPLMLCSSFL